MDFINHSNGFTSGTGACVDTTQVRSPTRQNIPALCGTLSGQHSNNLFKFLKNYLDIMIKIPVYVDTGASVTATTIAFTFGTTGSAIRTWKVNLPQF